MAINISKRANGTDEIARHGSTTVGDCSICVNEWTVRGWTVNLSTSMLPCKDEAQAQRLAEFLGRRAVDLADDVAEWMASDNAVDGLAILPTCDYCGLVLNDAGACDNDNCELNTTCHNVGEADNA